MGRRAFGGGRGRWLGLVLAVLAGAPAAWAQAAPGTPTETGTVVGAVALAVPEPDAQPPRYYRGPRYRAARGTDDDAAPSPLQSVVVYLDSVPAPPGGWPVPEAPARMRQRHDRFLPHVLPVLRGRVVSFPNDDSHYHNVFSVVAGDRFDLGRYGQGDTRLQTFIDPAVVVVRCEIHPGMKAYILVRGNPHFAVPAADGRFHLDGVPAGTWRLAAWHPTRGRQSRVVTVPAGGSVSADFDF